MAKKKKTDNKKDKKQEKGKNKKRTSIRYKNYEIKEGKIKRKNKFCPKCGVGIFLANHKDRLKCGKCNYLEKKNN